MSSVTEKTTPNPCKLTVLFPGDVERLVYVTDYSPPRKMTFIYSDWTMLSVTITATQKTDSKCLIDFRVGTKRTSYLYHVCINLAIAPTFIAVMYF